MLTANGFSPLSSERRVSACALPLRVAEMSELRVQGFGERIMIGVSGCVLVGGIVAFDDTLRERMGGVFQGNAIQEITTAGLSLQRVIRTTTEAAGYHGGQDPMLVIFTVAAIV